MTAGSKGILILPQLIYETRSWALAANNLKRQSRLGGIPVEQFLKLKLFCVPKDFEIVVCNLMPFNSN